jgi:hypothetical protein
MQPFCYSGLRSENAATGGSDFSAFRLPPLARMRRQPNHVVLAREGLLHAA